MRYFLESLDGEEIVSPDFVTGSCKPVDNPVTFEYIPTGNEEPKTTHKVTEVFKNPDGSIKGKNVELILEAPEGKWHVFETRTGEKIDITDKEEWDLSNCQDFQKIYKGIESCCIYHKFTKEEQKEQDKLKEKYIEEQELEKHNKALLKELPEFEDDTDGAICELYELVEPVFNQLKIKVKIETYSKIAKAYARRILRGEITLEDVPESIREEVRRILEENKKK